MSRRWLIRRVGVAILVLFIALLVNFMIPRLMPGDAADIYAAAGRMTEEERLAIVARFGLDQSLWTQFTRYIVNSFQGDFGLSFTYFPSSVTSKIFAALPWSLFLIINAMILQVIIAFILGSTSAWKQGGKFDGTTQAVALALWATPMFWLAMLALYFFGQTLG